MQSCVFSFLNAHFYLFCKSRCVQECICDDALGHIALWHVGSLPCFFVRSCMRSGITGDALVPHCALACFVLRYGMSGLCAHTSVVVFCAQAILTMLQWTASTRDRGRNQRSAFSITQLHTSVQQYVARVTLPTISHMPKNSPITQMHTSVQPSVLLQSHNCIQACNNWSRG